MRKRETQDLDREYQDAGIIFSDFDLANFDKEIAAYMTLKTLSDGSVINFFDERKFMIDHGAMNVKGEVVMKNLRQLSDGTFDCRPIMFEMISDKIAQWSKWKGRRDYAKKMDMLQLQKMADELPGKLSTSARMDKTEALG